MMAVAVADQESFTQSKHGWLILLVFGIEVSFLFMPVWALCHQIFGNGTYFRR
jgi:hypothetical protein